MKAMDEIQKENDMKISRNAQLMFYNYFVDQIGKIYWTFSIIIFFICLITNKISKLFDKK